MQLRAAPAVTPISSTLGGRRRRGRMWGKLFCWGDAEPPGRFCILCRAATSSFGVVFLSEKPSETLDASRGAGGRSGVFWPDVVPGNPRVSFSRLSRRCCAGGRRKPRGPVLGPYVPPQKQLFPGVGSHDAPWTGMRSCSCCRQQVFGWWGARAAVGAVGLGFRAGRARWWRRGKGSCAGDVSWEGGGAADGDFGQLLLMV